MNTNPTDLPGQTAFTNHIPVELPATPVELFQSEDGKEWRLAGHDEEGGRLFVPAHLDPANVARWLWAEESYLVEAVGAFSPVERAA
ncbi:hypothetical protein [Streptomyces sp. NPDC056169]|uniref:hypothetical protein n=1 Tax=Streptomyces sp. NPDC056169 TaxID=3345734 RepID=UPI0035E29658